MCVDCVVHCIDGRQDGPDTVDLGVVVVDLRDNKKDGHKKDREGEGRDERIRGDIQSLYIGGAESLGAENLEELLREIVELLLVGPDGLVEGDDVWQGAEHGESHDCELGGEDAIRDVSRSDVAGGQGLYEMEEPGCGSVYIIMS